jgi:hypothetical protein
MKFIFISIYIFLKLKKPAIRKEGRKEERKGEREGGIMVTTRLSRAVEGRSNLEDWEAR